jgi:hypothetical protein
MDVTYAYSGLSGVYQTSDGTALALSPELSRPEQVKFKGIVRNPLVYREAMLSLQSVVTFDARPQPKDKSEYLKWAEQEIERLTWGMVDTKGVLTASEKQRIVQLNSRKNAMNAEMDEYMKVYNQHRRSFQRFLAKRARHLLWIFDPVISVHPDAVTFEAFSMDESAYAALSVPMDGFNNVHDVNYGTTNIDFSHKLGQEMRRVRTYLPLSLEVNPGGFIVDLDVKPPYVEKKIDLPESWIKGFLQVSSAAALPAVEFVMQPIDVYNIISFLRHFKAHKSPRSLRFKLVPDEPISVLIEPWDVLIETETVYDGYTQQDVRIWGRRRLFLLERLLPITKQFRVRLIGSGFPCFVIAELQSGMTFTLGLSGWTAKDWSGGAAFSALAGYIGFFLNPNFQAHLKNVRYATITNLKENLALPNREFQESLATLYRRGLGFYDLAADVVRYRELMAFPIPEELIAPSEVEQKAMELLVSDKLTEVEIRLIEDDPIADQWSGKATAPRKYTKKKAHPSLILGEAGEVVHAECDCRTFSRFGLKAGPCEHLLALQMAMIKKQSVEATIKNSLQ